ncbi:hypothetical protein B0C58_004616 [Salmonella enterica subsp. enterica serovar Oranienburg]|nr:hypothetical protein [Salmonella enterica subsp. enterica serovar Oranienburg]
MTENTPELVLPDLSNIGQLDQFLITHPKGSILARIVLGCELYFAPPDDYPAFYADLIWAVGDYYSRYGEFVNRYTLPNNAGSGKIKGDPMPKFWQAVASQDPDYGMGGDSGGKSNRATTPPHGRLPSRGRSHITGSYHHSLPPCRLVKGRMVTALANWRI